MASPSRRSPQNAIGLCASWPMTSITRLISATRLLAVRQALYDPSESERTVISQLYHGYITAISRLYQSKAAGALALKLTHQAYRPGS